MYYSKPFSNDINYQNYNLSLANKSKTNLNNIHQKCYSNYSNSQKGEFLRNYRKFNILDINNEYTNDEYINSEYNNNIFDNLDIKEYNFHNYKGLNDIKYKKLKLKEEYEYIKLINELKKLEKIYSIKLNNLRQKRINAFQKQNNSGKKNEFFVNINNNNNKMNTKYKSVFDRTNNKNNKNITNIKDLSEIYSKMENNNPGRSLLKNLAKSHMNNNIDLNIKSNKNNNKMNNTNNIKINNNKNIHKFQKNFNTININKPNKIKYFDINNNQNNIIQKNRSGNLYAPLCNNVYNNNKNFDLKKNINQFTLNENKKIMNNKNFQKINKKMPTNNSIREENEDDINSGYLSDLAKDLIETLSKNQTNQKSYNKNQNQKFININNDKKNINTNFFENKINNYFNENINKGNDNHYVIRGQNYNNINNNNLYKNNINVCGNINQIDQGFNNIEQSRYLDIKINNMNYQQIQISNSNIVLDPSFSKDNLILKEKSNNNNEIFPEFKENQIKKRKKKIVGFDLRQNRTYYYHIESTLEDSYLVSCYENNKISDFQKSSMNLNEYINKLKINITPNPCIKHFDEKSIKMNEKYVLAENMDEKEIIPDLCEENDEDIQSLRAQIRDSIDKVSQNSCKEGINLLDYINEMIMDDSSDIIEEYDV